MDEGFRGLRLHNTLTGKKEDFVPFDPRNVRMYVCGPTVYDYAHIGNARPVIVFDVLFRLLRHLYGAEHVTYVRNITDVDDKIILRAADEYPGLPLNEAIGKVTETTEKQFHEDAAALGCLAPTVEPRATEHIAEMVEMIGVLVAEGYAYAEQGHVLFEVRKWKAADGSAEYGKLSRRSLDEMIAGARVEVAPYKRDPMDFVLWKPSKAGEPSWPSPWGEGRPGWHIECSAMARKHLGDTFDIHAGGIDLVFPHHENEIAQSRTANHTELMAKYWLHNGYLQVEGRKMAKSEGNFVTIRELLNDWHGEVLRLQMLTTHYRQPFNWTRDRCEEAREELAQWALAINGEEAEADAELRAQHRQFPTPSAKLVRALSDELNTPEALAIIRADYKEARRGDAEAVKRLAQNAEFLGVLRPTKLGVYALGAAGIDARGAVLTHEGEAEALRTAVANGQAFRVEALVRQLADDGIGVDIASDGYVTFRGGQEQRDLSARIELLKNARSAARSAKNFAEADRIRDELDAMGVQLKDSKDPKTGELVTTWEVKR